MGLAERLQEGGSHARGHRRGGAVYAGTPPPQALLQLAAEAFALARHFCFSSHVQARKDSRARAEVHRTSDALAPDQRLAEMRRVIVIGGGIGGLTAALALLRRGIDVDLFEQSNQLKEAGAGIQIGSNGTRVLYALGLEQALAGVKVMPAGRE